MSDATPAPVAIFGGTFNPVHFGHLRSARELLDLLSLAELRFMPAAIPPHRQAPEVSAADRAAMVELAIAREPRFSCDRRELERDGPSYSYDSLVELRAELGEQRPLCLVIGCDALLGLPRWHRWEELFDLAHLVVMARPGWSLPHTGELPGLVAQRGINVHELGDRPAGGLLNVSLEPQDISATGIRSLLQSGAAVRHLLPESVAQYIEEQRLYRRR